MFNHDGQCRDVQLATSKRRQVLPTRFHPSFQTANIVVSSWRLAMSGGKAVHKWISRHFKKSDESHTFLVVISTPKRSSHPFHQERQVIDEARSSHADLCRHWLLHTAMREENGHQHIARRHPSLPRTRLAKATGTWQTHS